MIRTVRALIVAACSALAWLAWTHPVVTSACVCVWLLACAVWLVAALWGLR